ncbi:HET-domain-containing protein [Phaeosphaeriaceae sp. SRC1lsM3a]|nr:HET-domain-containing protein [Stagonospora sp. SRC1lsM3a]
MKRLLSFSSASTTHQEAQQDHTPEPKDDHTGSESNLQLAQFWAHDCLSAHKECARGSVFSSPPALPSRVVDVEDLENPYLLVTQGQRDNYLTLSYCWGQGKRLLTTKESLTSSQRMLPTDDQIPATFRDAFAVTKALGFRYIWIDALCILQDDFQDLQIELGRMGEIYQCSTITIFASKGGSTDSGLFTKRDGQLYKPCNTVIKQALKDGFRRIEVAFVHPQQEFDDPLTERGWVLQEQILAQRQLIFTPHEMRWTCKARILSETRPHKTRDYGANERPGYETVAATPLNSMRLLVANPKLHRSIDWQAAAENPPRMHYVSWYGTVVSYSARQLSIPTDKLPAIAGIAQLIHKHFGCEYGAGLWKNDLPLGLCWHTAKTLADDNDSRAALDEISSQPEEYIAPSWSWAAIRNRGVNWPVDPTRDLEEVPREGVDILDWAFTYPKDAVVTFGQITSGVLTVQGSLKEVLLIPLPNQTKSVWNVRPIWPAFALDPKTASIIGEAALDSPGVYQYFRNQYRERERNASLQPQIPMPLGVPAYSLPTYVFEKGRYRHAYALILVPIDHIEHQYRRIGLSYAKEVLPSQLRWDTEHSNTCIGRHKRRQSIHIV